MAGCGLGKQGSKQKISFAFIAWKSSRNWIHPNLLSKLAKLDGKQLILAECRWGLKVRIAITLE